MNSTASTLLLHMKLQLYSIQELTSLFKNFFTFWQCFPRAYFTFQELHCLLTTFSKSLLHFSRTSLPIFQELASLFKNFVAFWQHFPRAYFTFQELHCLFSKSLLHFSRTSLPSWRRRRKLHTFSIGHLTFWRTRAWNWCRHTSAHEAESLVFLPQSFSAITDSEYSTKHDVL